MLKAKAKREKRGNRWALCHWTDSEASGGFACLTPCFTLENIY